MGDPITNIEVIIFVIYAILVAVLELKYKSLMLIILGILGMVIGAKAGADDHVLVVIICFPSGLFFLLRGCCNAVWGQEFKFNKKDTDGQTSQNKKSAQE
jgi:hypothetical protein